MEEQGALEDNKAEKFLFQPPVNGAPSNLYLQPRLAPGFQLRCFIDISTLKTTDTSKVTGVTPNPLSPALTQTCISCWVLYIFNLWSHP